MEKIFFCVFDKEKECSVKDEFKLKPESLVEFCKICNVNKTAIYKSKDNFGLEMAKMMADFIRVFDERDKRLLTLLEETVKRVGN